jgi:hypothetical protein
VGGLLGMINTKQKLQRLKGVLEENPEGITIDLNTLKPKKFKSGFYIGISDNSHKDINFLVGEINKQLLKLQSRKGVYCGYWLDKKTNISYLDLSVYCLNLDIALLVAKQLNQKAIFDIKKMDSVYL